MEECKINTTQRGIRMNVFVYPKYLYLFQPPFFCISCLLFAVSFFLRSYLDLDISFSGEEADLYMQKAIVMALSAVDTLKGLFFVGNLFESLKVS